MISHNGDQYLLLVILYEFFMHFFRKIKNCLEIKKGILELKAWFYLLGNIIMNKYMQKIVWSSITVF